MRKPFVLLLASFVSLAAEAQAVSPSGGGRLVGLG
jgi:hypothetical protein